MLIHPDQFFSKFGSTALAAVRNAQNDPTREDQYRDAYSYARENGASVREARWAAKYASSAWNVLDVRNNALLPEDATRLLTDEIINVARRRPKLAMAIRSAGLTRDAGNMGNFTIVWQKWDDQEAAQVGMDPQVMAPYDQPGFSLDGAPIPVIYKDFRFSERQLLAHANQGIPLDETNATRAAELVADAEEALVVNGTNGPTWGGYTAYGATNHPSRITETTALDFGTVSNIQTAFNNVFAGAVAKNKFGPFAVQVSPNQFAEMLVNQSSIDRTELSRMLEMPYVASIEQNQFLADGSAIFVELRASTVQLAIAEDMRPIQWEYPGGFSTGVRVFESVVPMWKVDAANQLGVVHKTAI